MLPDIQRHILQKEQQEVDNNVLCIRRLSIVKKKYLYSTSSLYPLFIDHKRIRISQSYQNHVRGMMMEMIVHPAAWRCATYCFVGTDVTTHIFLQNARYFKQYKTSIACVHCGKPTFKSCGCGMQAKILEHIRFEDRCPNWPHVRFSF